MKKIYFLLVILLMLKVYGISQNPGDTIVVNTLNYSSQTRDTLIGFPTYPSNTYHKILMLYNIRCKDGNISQGTTGQTNIGCGEWDYSCNTYITDSSRVDSVVAIQKSHTITNFSGNTYPYIDQALYDYYSYIQTNTSGSTVVSETISNINSGTSSVNHVVSANERSGKSNYIFTQAELLSAGLVSGDINGIILNALDTSNTNFLRIRLKHTGLGSFDANNIDTSGFVECYFCNTSFSVGNNRLIFHTPFMWNGLDNLIIEFSFTNSVSDSTLSFVGGTTDSILGAYANNTYHINTGSGSTMGIPTDNMDVVNNELSVSFWVKGNSGVSTQNTSVIAARDSAFNRQLNVHLPWSNTNIYYDCGNDGSGYDRIYTSSNVGELEGSWQHWAFTKNVNSGEMKAYLNGNLWHSGTAKTKAIYIDSMILGSEANDNYIYNGKINELRVWNAEIDQTTIQNWMNCPLNSSHPNYANLIAYYPLNEGSGNTSNDESINNLIASFNGNAVWEFERGINISRFFTTINERPNVGFLQGTYTLSLLNDTVLDSVPRVSNTVTAYQIIPKTGSGQHDSIATINTNTYWYAQNEIVYDAITGNPIDSFLVSAIDTVFITDLEYYQRYPAKLELMSFVTPYGINLDLGMEGKTWIFDVTDYAPILNGQKRISVERGGQWQEDMDISFLFLVGTPIREVKNIWQIWRSTNSRSYTDIINDRYFKPVDIYIDTNVHYAKIKSVITGHGQEGEFIPRSHFINIDRGSEEFVWTEWTECADNPVYPQGGTWIYDRAGWCPGLPSDVSEFDISSMINPGDSTNIDYGMYTASGTSNYLVNNQLVTYGNANFSVDAAIIDVIAPSNRIEYFRSNSICSGPRIRIKNTGLSDLTQLDIEYWVNNTTQKETHTWVGNLSFTETEEIVLPTPVSLWNSISGTDNTFYVEVKNPNASVDEYTYNNTFQSHFSIPMVIPSSFYLLFKTNNAASETKYELFDDAGNLLFSRTNMANNTIYRDTFNIGVGCYSFVITDTDDDGIDFWANNDGIGYAFFREIGGGNIHRIEGDFGKSIVFTFTVDFPLTHEEIEANNPFVVYPTPGKEYVVVEGELSTNFSIHVYDNIGKTIEVPYSVNGNKIWLNTSSLPSGIYYISLINNGQYHSLKTVIKQ